MNLWHRLIAEDLECESVFLAVRRTNRLPHAPTFRGRCLQFEREIERALEERTRAFVLEIQRVSKEREL